MKPLRSPFLPRSKRFSALTDGGLALLLTVGLIQIVMCFGAATRLVPPLSHAYSGGQYPTCQTNALLNCEVGVTGKAKS